MDCELSDEGHTRHRWITWTRMSAILLKARNISISSVIKAMDMSQFSHLKKNSIPEVSEKQLKALEEEATFTQV